MKQYALVTFVLFFTFSCFRLGLSIDDQLDGSTQSDGDGDSDGDSDADGDGDSDADGDGDSDADGDGDSDADGDDDSDADGDGDSGDAAVSRVRFVESPSSSWVAHIIEPTTVELLDESGDRCVDCNGEVSFRLGVDPTPGATFLGYTTSPVRDGLATLSPSLDRMGRGFTLLIEAEDIGSAESPPFWVGLQDDFADGNLNLSMWSYFGHDDWVTVTSTLDIDFVHWSGPSMESGLESGNPFDFTDWCVEMEVQPMLMVPGVSNNETRLCLTIADDLGWARCIIATGGDILARSNAGGMVVDTSSTHYRPGDHRFWRICHDRALDNIILETSPDSSAWTVLHEAERNFEILEASFHIAAAAFSSDAVPNHARFDNAEVRPSTR